jgi:hypothetical protein
MMIGDRGRYARSIGDASSSWSSFTPSQNVGARSSHLYRATSALVGVGAVAAGVVLALIFAATLAVALVIGAAALALTALAWRLGGGPARIEARAHGHSWVAYGLHRRL